MSNIYFFRGKAATGKTTISNKLSKKINVPVLRKDDIFNKISKYIDDNSLNNNITMTFCQHSFKPTLIINQTLLQILD